MWRRNIVRGSAMRAATMPAEGKVSQGIGGGRNECRSGRAVQGDSTVRSEHRRIPPADRPAGRLRLLHHRHQVRQRERERLLPAQRPLVLPPVLRQQRPIQAVVRLLPRRHRRTDQGHVVPDRGDLQALRHVVTAVLGVRRRRARLRHPPLLRTPCLEQPHRGAPLRGTLLLGLPDGLSGLLTDVQVPLRVRRARSVPGRDSLARHQHRVRIDERAPKARRGGMRALATRHRVAEEPA